MRGARLRYGVADESEQENEEEADGERGDEGFFWAGQKNFRPDGEFSECREQIPLPEKKFFSGYGEIFFGMQKNFGRTEKIFPRSIKKFSDARPKLNPGIKKF